MRLTKQTGYALRILLHCALTPDRSVTAAEVARAQRITEHNVFKIVPMLVEGGFLGTTRGRGGGILPVRIMKAPIAIAVVPATVEP